MKNLLCFTRRHLLLGAVLVCPAIAPHALAAYGDYPTKPVTIGVAYGPGGLFAPADTLAAVVQSLNREVNALLASSDIRARFEADNLAVPKNSPAEFATYMRAKAVKFEKLVKDANIEVEQ